MVENSATATSVSVIILAAGQGTRMKSDTPKVLHAVGGKPMVWYMLNVARAVATSTVAVVIGHGADRVEAFLREEKNHPMPLAVVEQSRQLGTGHAVQQAQSAVASAPGGASSVCVILNGDTPLLTQATVQALLDRHHHAQATATILTTCLDDPTGYGRVIRGSSGDVVKIVEHRDATDDERAVREINVGTYVVETAFLFQTLETLTPQNAQGEYYLTDIIEAAVAKGRTVAALVADDPAETAGINNREHLAWAEEEMRRRVNRRWMLEGVTFVDPARTSVDTEVTIGRDCVLYPGVRLEGATHVGEGCVIRSNARITESRLGARVTILDSSVVQHAVVGDDVSIGPFAHLRPDTHVHDRAKVGNFVELKNTTLGEGSKANHLSYLGDTTVGCDVNIGAGTITCNYDGYQKAQTVIEDGVFVGSDTQLVAPVTVGARAMIAAGTTVTRPVPEDALAISRPPQENREGAAKRKRDAQGA